MKIGWLAPWYRWIEYAAYGQALERGRFRYLDRLADARRILVLGEGDGRALARLLAAAPLAEIDVFEISEEMLALAKARTADSGRVRFRNEDAVTARWPGAAYDGVVTLFFLDCFNELETRCLVQRIAAAMAPEARWLVTDFAIPSRGWRRCHAKLWISTMYRFFNVTTGLRTRALPPIETLLVEAGLRRIEMESERAGLIRSEVWIKGLGVEEVS